MKKPKLPIDKVLEYQVQEILDSVISDLSEDIPDVFVVEDKD